MKTSEMQASHYVYQANIRIDVPKNAPVLRELATKTRARRHAAIMAAAEETFLRIPGICDKELLTMLIDSVCTQQGATYHVSVLASCDTGKATGLTVDRRNRISDDLAAYAHVETVMLRVCVETADFAYMAEAISSDATASDPRMALLPQTATQYVTSLHAGNIRSVQTSTVPSTCGIVDFDVCVDVA